MLKGIDVSHWQGTTPSLTGLDFLFARSTYGTTKDDKYELHKGNALRAGLAFGAYHYGDTSKSVAAQLAACLAATAGVRMVVLDIEAGNMALTDARLFIAGLKAAGKFAGVYHSLSGYPWSLGQDFDWLAAWRTDAPPGPWEFWQYRGSPLDLDYYNGTRAQLNQITDSIGGPMGLAITLDITKDANPFGNLYTAKVVYSRAVRVRDGVEVSLSVGTDLGVVQAGVFNSGAIFAFNHLGELHIISQSNVSAVVIKAPVLVPPPDDGYTKVTQDAAVAAQKAADQAAINAANAAAAKSAAEAATAPAKERERIATAEATRIKAI